MQPYLWGEISCHRHFKQRLLSENIYISRLKSSGQTIEHLVATNAVASLWTRARLPIRDVTMTKMLAYHS